MKKTREYLSVQLIVSDECKALAHLKRQKKKKKKQTAGYYLELFYKYLNHY